MCRWAQRTLPEFLLMCMQDPENRKSSIAFTPWKEYELSVAEVQLEGTALKLWRARSRAPGEVNLIGRKDEPMLQFDLDLGMRVDVEKKVVAWRNQAQVAVGLKGSSGFCRDCCI